LRISTSGAKNEHFNLPKNSFYLDPALNPPLKVPFCTLEAIYPLYRAGACFRASFCGPFENQGQWSVSRLPGAWKYGRNFADF